MYLENSTYMMQKTIIGANLVCLKYDPTTPLQDDAAISSSTTDEYSGLSTWSVCDLHVTTYLSRFIFVEVHADVINIKPLEAPIPHMFKDFKISSNDKNTNKYI